MTNQLDAAVLCLEISAHEKVLEVVVVVVLVLVLVVLFLWLLLLLLVLLLVVLVSFSVPSLRDEDPTSTDDLLFEGMDQKV